MLDSGRRNRYIQNMTEILPAILIVEHDRLTLDLYQRALGQDFCIMTASDEQKALLLLESEDIRAIILEPVGLGDKGQSLLTRVKSKTRTRRLPVIVCTTMDERRLGFEMGASEYLVKPILPNTLRQMLLRVVAAA